MAERIAAATPVHLTVAFLTPLPEEPLAYEPTVVAGVWAELLNKARAQARDDLAALKERLAASGMSFEIRTVEALGRDLGRVAAVHARYADITIMERPTSDAASDMRLEMIEGVLFHSGRPALIVPPGWTGPALGRNVLIAWDASREATRALAEARNFLARSEQVIVLTVNAKPKAFGHGEQPGMNIAAHLKRRGVNVNVRNIETSGGVVVSRALLAECKNSGADLMVMGAYAHARWREMVFGGATRDLLEATSIPILTAH
jgi:nucleotide-binding universal stress UspA family protein